MNKVLIGIVAVIVIIATMAIGGYNSLVSMNENVTGKWSQVENQLQRRNDLIPNLVSTVQGMASHEKSVIKEVTDARAKMGGATSPKALANASGQLTSALSRLLVVVENYPNIKSDASFRQLSDELAGTENRIAVARKDYNDSVQIFNTKIKTFPTVIFAGMLNFDQKEYFKADESAKEVPKVKF